MIVLSLVLANNTILLYFFLFFVRIDLYFLNIAVNIENSGANIEFTIPRGPLTNEAQVLIETLPLRAEMKIMLKVIQILSHCLCFSLIKSLSFLSSKGWFSVSSILFSLKSRLCFHLPDLSLIYQSSYILFYHFLIVIRCEWIDMF